MYEKQCFGSGSAMSIDLLSWILSILRMWVRIRDQRKFTQILKNKPDFHPFKTALYQRRYDTYRSVTYGSSSSGSYGSSSSIVTAGGLTAGLRWAVSKDGDAVSAGTGCR